MTQVEANLIVHEQEGDRVQMADVEMRFKARSGSTASEAAVHEWSLPARRLAAPPHRHEHEDEFLYVIEGQVTVEQDGERSSAEPGTLVVLPRGRFHTFWNDGDEPARLLVVIAPGQLDGYFEEASAMIGVDKAPDMEGLAGLAQRYGLTLQFQRLPDLMREHGLESEIPLPLGAPPSDGG